MTADNLSAWQAAEDARNLAHVERVAAHDAVELSRRWAAGAPTDDTDPLELARSMHRAAQNPPNTNTGQEAPQ